MLPHDRLSRFVQMEQDSALLRAQFDALTLAHRYFQGPGKLTAVSVSDASGDGSINVVFLDVQIRFRMLFIFSDAFEPRGRVVCMHRHCTYGNWVHDNIGAFTFDSEGMTDIEHGSEGQTLDLHADAPEIILMFLEKAAAANKCL